MNTTDGFLAIWSAAGPIVGVVIGVMPAHSFRAAAKAANARADRMADEIADMGKGWQIWGKMAHESR